MIRRLLMLIIVLLMNLNAKSCDVCGTSSMASGIGLWAAYQSNIFKIKWYDSSFESVLSSGHQSKDYFQTVEAQLSYFVLPKCRVVLTQAYKFNQRQQGELVQNLNGFSDTHLAIVYTVLNNTEIGKSLSLYLDAGAGFKAANGKYNDDLTDEDLPINFNLGNGSIAWTLQNNMTLKKDNVGLVVNNNYKINRPTVEGDQFGNQWSSTIATYYKVEFKNDWKILPFVGMYYENLAKDKYPTGKSIEVSGGNGYFVSGGLNLNINNFLLGLSMLQPIRQNYATKEIKSNGRFAVELSYFFN